MSSEKELFVEGISKCEKILKILLSEDIFDEEGVEVYLNSNKDVKVVIPSCKNGPKNMRKHSTLQQPSKTQRRSCINKIFLNNISNSLKIESTRTGLRDRTQSDKVLQV